MPLSMGGKPIGTTAFGCAMTGGMGMTQRKPMTVEEFLEWERRQELRYEFDGFQAVAVTGGTANHAVIADNLRDGLRQRLKSPCRAFRSDLKVLVNGRVRYPDAVVTCSPVPGTADTVPNPVVVFEVLSPCTASVDRVTKNTEYESTSSIQRYVMLEQNQIAATVFYEMAADGSVRSCAIVRCWRCRRSAWNSRCLTSTRASSCHHRKPTTSTCPSR